MRHPVSIDGVEKLGGKTFQPFRHEGCSTELTCEFQADTETIVVAADGNESVDSEFMSMGDMAYAFVRCPECKRPLKWILYYNNYKPS